MAVADILRDLGPTEPPPSVSALGGHDAFVAALPTLDPTLLPVAAEAISADWDSVEAPTPAVEALVARLVDVEAPLSAATYVDTLLRLAVMNGDATVVRMLMTTLLSLVEGDPPSAERALRAGYALRAAVDLSLLDVGVSAHSVLGVVENIGDVRPELAPGLARAAGRLWEHHDEDFLREVLEQRVLPHDEAAGDAWVELGLRSLRDAFRNEEAAPTAAALEQAVELFERARGEDENRPDARVFGAAARAVLAFPQDAAAMGAALDELTSARAEIARYGATEQQAFRGAAPLRSIAGWHVLAAKLRELRSHLDKPDLLHLRPAVEALGESYAGMRLGVLQHETKGLVGFIQPVIREEVGRSPGLAEAVEQYAREEAAPSGARDLAAEVVRPKAEPNLSQRQTWRQRRRLR